MPRLPGIRILAFVGLGLVAATASAQRDFYCYDDENGRRVCGNALPPEAAGRDRDVFNSEGVRVGREQGELTPEQERELQEQRLLEEEQAREAEERRRRGQVLLDSYTSVEDIEDQRDRRLEQIDGQIGLIETSLGNLETKLAELEQRATRFAPLNKSENARPLPENIALDIERTRSSIVRFRERLEQNRADKEETRENFESDIAYYRELTGEDA